MGDASASVTLEAREMTLREYVEQLPPKHRAIREMEELEAELAAWEKRAALFVEQGERVEALEAELEQWRADERDRRELSPDEIELGRPLTMMEQSWMDEKRKVAQLEKERDAIEAELERTQELSEIGERNWLDQNEHLRETQIELTKARAERDALKEALEEIIQWANAYPVSVFPEPDLKKAHELLRAGGMSLDSVSASAMRHVLDGVTRIAKGAIGDGE